MELVVTTLELSLLLFNSPLTYGTFFPDALTGRGSDVTHRNQQNGFTKVINNIQDKQHLGDNS